MEHYCKGRNEEEELTSLNIPLEQGILPERHGWMLVTGGTRIETAVAPALALLQEEGALVLAASGNSAAKVVAIAELLKEKVEGLWQVTRIGERLVKEFWEPKTEELETLVVTRIQPKIHILLSCNRIEGGDEVQGPGCDLLLTKKEKSKRPKNKKKGNTKKKSAASET